MYTHILAPTDGSELAQKGVNQALSLAKALGSKVTILTATEPFPKVTRSDGWVAGPGDVRRYEEQNEQYAAELLTNITAEAEKLGVTADTLHVSSASAATSIVETAQLRDCDLIVMSSHGHRGIARMFLGSQTSEVLAHSTIPVLIVR